MSDADIQKAYALGASPEVVEQLKALKFNWAKVWPFLLKVLKELGESGLLGGENSVPAE